MPNWLRIRHPPSLRLTSLRISLLSTWLRALMIVPLSSGTFESISVKFTHIPLLCSSFIMILKFILPVISISFWFIRLSKYPRLYFISISPYFCLLSTEAMLDGRCSGIGVPDGGGPSYQKPSASHTGEAGRPKADKLRAEAHRSKVGHHFGKVLLKVTI